MKTLLTAIVILTLTCQARSQSAYATTQPMISGTSQEEGPQANNDDYESENIIRDNSLPDGYMLQGTKMVSVEDGVITLLTQDVVLTNGTRIRPDGFIFRKNKPKLLLNIGEYVDGSGKILPIKDYEKNLFKQF